MIKPFALHVAHMAYGQAVCTTCSANGALGVQNGIPIGPYALQVAHMIYGQVDWAMTMASYAYDYGLRQWLWLWLWLQLMQASNV